MKVDSFNEEIGADQEGGPWSWSDDSGIVTDAFDD